MGSDHLRALPHGAVGPELFRPDSRLRGGGKSTLHFFDDIGCAVIWLDKQPWRGDPRTEIWVNDWRNGAWIDARTAYYLKGKETPMQYGLGAQTEPMPGAIDYAAAKTHIFEVEAHFNAPVFNPQAATGHRHLHLTE